MALVVVLAGCGDDPPSEPIEELARYLPAGDPGFIAFADLAEAREQLGLPADADALQFELLTSEEYDPGMPEVRLLEAARIATPFVGLEVTGSVEVVQSGEQIDSEVTTLDPELDPVTAAFNGGAISAAVMGGSREAVAVVRTSQPFAELSDALEDEGYERNGDVLSKPGAEIGEVVDAGDGIWVLGIKDTSATDAVADQPGGPTAVLDLLEPADEPVAHATAGFDETCVTGYGGWQAASGETGTFRIAVNGTADTDRVEREGFEKYTEVNLGQPTADDEYIEVPFTGGEGGASPLRDLQVSLGEDLYDCE